MNRFSPFVISLILHLILLTLALSQQGTGNGNGQKQASKNIEILPKVVDVSIVDTPMPTDKGTVTVPKPKLHKDGLTECVDDSWYGGIGITQDYMSHTIISVADGYPADKAGLKTGDMIIGIVTNDDDIRGEPGTTIVLSVRKASGDVMTVEMIRDRICTGEKLPD